MTARVSWKPAEAERIMERQERDPGVNPSVIRRDDARDVFMIK